MHWCIDCGSALAEAEVEYADKQSIAIDVASRSWTGVADARHGIRRWRRADEPAYAVIWTTTPWTLPANQAVALHPELEYVTRSRPTKRPARLAEGLRKRHPGPLGHRRYRVLGEAAGAALEGIAASATPSTTARCRSSSGEHVTLDAGTGAVHTAPGHGLEDYIVGQRYGLPVDNPVGGDGRFLPRPAALRRQERLQANEQVVETLARRRPAARRQASPTAIRTAGATRRRSSSAPRRSGSSAWTSAGRELRETALREIDETAFYPDWGQAASRA